MLIIVVIITIIIILLFVMSFIQGNYIYTPETAQVYRVYYYY